MHSEDQEIRAADFKPLRAGIRQPVDQDEMRCPLCQAILASQTGNLLAEKINE